MQPTWAESLFTIEIHFRWSMIVALMRCNEGSVMLHDFMAPHAWLTARLAIFILRLLNTDLIVDFADYRRRIEQIHFNPGPPNDQCGLGFFYAFNPDLAKDGACVSQWWRCAVQNQTGA